MDLIEIVWDGADWMHLGQVWAVVNPVMNHLVPKKAGHLLIS
jgi:hypothetical protein